MEKRYFKINGIFNLECGQSLSDINIVYHISKDFEVPQSQQGGSGKENLSGRKKVIWITHALTANSDPSDWWNVLVGEGKFFDPRKYTIICANILGSCYGSTSAKSINPKTGKPYLLDFPKITVRDIAACHNLLCKHLKISHIDLLIGGSVGGFQALEWSIINSNKIKGLVLLACNARFTPWGSAFNESQRMALRSDSTFEQQCYKQVNGEIIPTGGKKGLAAARSIALISYRSYQGYNSTQFESDTNCIYPTRAASYQQYQGKKLADRFDAYSYLTMLDITDSHNVARGRGSIENALQQVKAKTLCIGIDSDILFPVQEQQFMAENIPNARFTQISSAFGHDGFLLEYKQIQEAIEKEDFLK